MCPGQFLDSLFEARIVGRDCKVVLLRKGIPEHLRRAGIGERARDKLEADGVDRGRRRKCPGVSDFDNARHELGPDRGGGGARISERNLPVLGSKCAGVERERGVCSGAPDDDARS
jgi:hypothetical protein